MSVEINPVAKKSVKVVPESQIKENCEYVGPLTSRMGGNFVSFETNVENANNDLINQSVEKGMTHLVMSDPKQSDGTTFTVSENCNNCVIMSAKGYKCSK